MFIEGDDCITGHETRFGTFGAFGGGLVLGVDSRSECWKLETGTTVTTPQ